jgi:small subunit ribosomal protein S15
MSRMYSRKKGKSGSHKPLKAKTDWVKVKPAEIEKAIVELAKEGKPSAEIGMILRDQYGVPSTRAVAKKKVSAVMKENKVYNDKFPEDMYNLIVKAVDLKAHMSKNKKDYTSYRGLELTESKIRRLAKFYKKKGTLPAEWKWDIDKAKLWVKQ